MNYNNFRRGRSPPPPHPFSYNGSMRPMPNHRDFDNPYHTANPYEGRPGRLPPGKIPQAPMSPLPSHPTQLPPPPVALHPYMDVPVHHQNYSPHYREQLYGPTQLPPPPPQPSNSYRTAIGHRDPYSSSSHPHHQGVPPPRSSSPPYKILCITNINNKINDGSVKDALTSDFSRFGDISVSVCHDNNERLAYIYFRSCDEAREARQVKTRTLLFDKPIDIEPIYEPVRGTGSPGKMSPNGPVLPTAYSPRKRSVSPSGYPRESNISIASNRRQPPQPPHPMHGDIPATPPGYLPQHGSTPPDFGHGPGSYHHGLSPQPPVLAPIAPSYDRRAPHRGYNPYPPSYSPPRETHRPVYASQPMPYPSHARERPQGERMHVSSRSPHRDPYYPIEPRSGPPAHHHNHHQSASSSSVIGRYPSRSSRHSNAIGNYREDHIRHRYPPDPPARFMSREFRREKFGSDPYPGDHDEGRPSRVLLVNNIDTTKTELDLKELFEPFGIVEDMEVKKVASDVSSALVKFSSMDGAYKAKTANNGRHFGAMRLRIVYGKVSASRRLWIGGLSPGWTVSMMEDECGKFGDLASMDYTSGRPYCYVEYETANQAQFAAYHMRATLTPASERKIRIEFVDPERSEKLLPRHSSNTQVSDTNSKRPAPESIGDIDASPRSTGGLSGRKRSVSPASDLSSSKRLCQPGELPLAANTFKQERLVAAAAAKARTSSTTSSTASQSIDKSGKVSDTQDSNELNNNSDIEQIASNGDFATREQALGTEPASQEAPSLIVLSQCTNIKELVACCSVSWPSQIALRNFIFPAQIHMCSGRKQIIDRYFSRPSGDNGHSTSPLLRITQRWRLHPQPKLEEVKRRMQSGNLGILILTARHDNSASSRQIAPPSSSAAESLVALSSDNNSANQTEIRENGSSRQNGDIDNKEQDETPHTPADKAENSIRPVNSMDSSTAANNSLTTLGAAGPSTPNNAGTPPTSGSSTQSRPLRNLISYLEQKDAAGVISLSASIENSGEQALVTPEGASSSSKLLYAFPPGDFALNLLKRKTPNLLPEAVKDEFLLGVIVSGNVEGSKV